MVSRSCSVFATMAHRWLLPYCARCLCSHAPTLAEMYRPLLDACPFLYDCTSSGCIAILQLLRVEICDVNDPLMVAGALQSTFYILMRGEVRVEVQDRPKKHTVETYVPGGRVGGPPDKRAAEMGTSRKVGMHGRTDKAGTLLGFHDVFEPMALLEYTVRAVTRCSLLSITRGQLKEVLTIYAEDRIPLTKAIELAASTLVQASHRRKGTKKSTDMTAVASGAAVDNSASPRSTSGQQPPCGGESAERDVTLVTDLMTAGASDLTISKSVGGASTTTGRDAQIEALRNEVAELRSVLSEHTMLLK